MHSFLSFKPWDYLESCKNELVHHRKDLTCYSLNLKVLILVIGKQPLDLDSRTHATKDLRHDGTCLIFQKITLRCS